jgi:hypothetical protein
MHAHLLLEGILVGEQRAAHTLANDANVRSLAGIFEGATEGG